jgi:hypothetical protein
MTIILTSTGTYASLIAEDVLAGLRITFLSHADLSCRPALLQYVIHL